MKLLFSLFFFLPLTFPWIAQAANTATYDFVQITGEGEIKVKPDFATLNVVVYSRAQSAQQAQKDNAKEMARVDKVVRQDFKIDPKDLQSRGFQVNPQYDYQKDKPVYKGMLVTHILNIKFRKVEDVGNLLDHLASNSNQEAFGVRIEDLSFGTDQLKSYQLQALEEAMADAKSRAQTLAKSSGHTLSTIHKISDSKIATEFEPMREMAKANFSMAADSSSSTQVAAGEISVRARVHVEYEMR